MERVTHRVMPVPLMLRGPRIPVPLLEPAVDRKAVDPVAWRWRTFGTAALFFFAHLHRAMCGLVAEHRTTVGPVAEEGRSRLACSIRVPACTSPNDPIAGRSKHSHGHASAALSVALAHHAVAGGAGGDQGDGGQQEEEANEGGDAAGHDRAV